MSQWRAKLFDFLARCRRACLSCAYTPHETAFGAALGVAVALLPIAPLQLALLAALCLRLRCHRPLAFITVWLLNPITIVPIYAAEFWCGQLLCRRWLAVETSLTDLSCASALSLTHQCPRALLALLLGGVLCSIAFGVLTYVVTRFIVWCLPRTSHAQQVS